MATITPYHIKQLEQESGFSSELGDLLFPAAAKMHAFNRLVVQCSQVIQALQHNWRTGAQSTKTWYEDYNKESIFFFLPSE